MSSDNDLDANNAIQGGPPLGRRAKFEMIFAKALNSSTDLITEDLFLDSLQKFQQSVSDNNKNIIPGSAQQYAEQLRDKAKEIFNEEVNRPAIKETSSVALGDSEVRLDDDHAPFLEWLDLVDKLVDQSSGSLDNDNPVVDPVEVSKAVRIDKKKREKELLLEILKNMQVRNAEKQRSVVDKRERAKRILQHVEEMATTTDV